jgi:hypothetical protein
MLGLASYAWQHTRVPGATAFGAAFFLSAAWSICMLTDPYNTDLASRILWLRLRYTFAIFITTFFLIMAAQVTGSERWLTRRVLTALFVMPVFIVIASWTGDYHHLFRYDFQLEFNGVFYALTWKNGPLSLVGMIYAYAIGFIGAFVILIRLILPGQPRYYWRTVLMLVAGLIPSLPICYLANPPDGLVNFRPAPEHSGFYSQSPYFEVKSLSWPNWLTASCLPICGMACWCSTSKTGLLT